MFWWRKEDRRDAAIAADKMLSRASVEDVKNAMSRLDTVLDQMRETNQERRNAKPD
jgi:hypothetical protein